MKEKGKKKLWWLWLLLGLVALAGIAVGCWFMFLQPKDEAVNTKLYWNVERARYVAQGVQGTSSRRPETDGYYYVKMAVDGQQEDIKVADPNIVNQMDFQELMCLAFDENGVVTEVLPVEEVAGNIVADKYVVESVTDTQIVCNTSVKYKGLQVTFDIDEDTKIWEIGDFEPMIGCAGTVKEGDQLIIVEDFNGHIDTVFTLPYVPPGDVYWNITRMWDSTLQVTTREPDMFGYYSYDFAVNGEQVTLKTNLKDVADYIDKHSSRNMGLVLDEDGNITEVLNAGNIVCGGGLLCNGYKVTKLNDGEVTFASGSTEYTETISRDCKFFNVSGTGKYIGEPIDGIQLGDTVTVLKDRRYQVCLVFITGRMTDADVFWVVERNSVWNRTTWTTDRKKASDGYYYIKLAGNGEQITVKTQSYELANQIDSNVCWAVELEGDEIVSAQAAPNRYGGSMFAPYYVVTALENGQITAESGTNIRQAKLSDQCEVYNVSSSASFVGEKTEVRVGDTIYGLTDMNGTVQYLFVTSRANTGYIYWNVHRKYDDKTKETTRVPGPDGYYYFEMVVNGQTQWLRTDDKKIATQVDLVVTRARGLVVTGDIIRAVVAPETLEGYKGVKPDASWATVQSITGDKAVVKKSNGELMTVTFSQWCKFYNVTDAYTDHRGEETSLRVGDTIVTLKNQYGKAVITYICGGRTAAFNTNETACGCAHADWVEWDGTTPLTTGHYYLTKDIAAPAGGWTLSNGTTYLRLDGHTISGNTRIFMLNNNATLYLCGHNGGGTVSGSAGDTGSGATIQGGGSSSRLYVYNVDLVNNQTGSKTSENGGVLSVSGLCELHDVNISGGEASRKGGNLAVMPTGSLEYYGGTVTGGEAKLDGGNIVITGNAYFEDVTVTDGQCPSGGNVSITAKDKTAIINGCNISSSASGGQGLYLVSGELELRGSIQITGHKDYNLMLAANTMLDISGMDSASRVGISMANPGVFAENTTDTMKASFESDEKALDILFENGSLSVASKHSHCVCGGQLAGHSCTKLGYVELTQEMFDNAGAATAPVRVSGTTYRLTGGTYYLEESITVAGQIIVEGNANICLNGKTFTSSKNRVLVVAGDVLSIGDCVGTGKIVGYKAATAATILVQGSGGASGVKGTLNIYSGTIVGGETTNSASGQAGNIQVLYGTLNVYGGTLLGGKALGQGGNILVAANQTMNIYGGTITDGTASRGNGIYIVAGANVTLDGKAQIDSIYLSGASLIVKNMDTGKVIDLESSNSGVFAENVTTDYSGCFKVSGREVVYDAAAKTLSIGAGTVPAGHSHCLCNGEIDGHSCANVTWQPLNEEDLLAGNYKTDGSVYYYLTEDVQLTKAVTIGRKTLHICLNGKTITAPAAARAFILNGSTLDLTDCQSGGKVVGTKAGNGVAILAQGYSGGANGDKSTLNLYGGTVVGGEATSSHGGAISITGGTMNMYGGKVEGGKAKTFGGAIFVDQKQYLNLYGGVVTSGTAGTKGKCVLGGANAYITVGGDVRLDELYVVSVNKISVSSDVALTDKASIVIYMDAPGLLANDVAVDCSKAFSAAGYQVVWDEAAKTLTLKVAL